MHVEADVDRPDVSPRRPDHPGGRGQALYETAQVQGKGRRRAPDQHPPPRSRTSQTTRHEAIREHGRRSSTRTRQRRFRANTTVPLTRLSGARCALGRTSEEHPAMSWYSRSPSMRGGRSTGASHDSRHRRLPPPRADASKNPRKCWPQPLPGTPARNRTGRSHPPAPASATAGALAQAGVQEVGFGSLPPDLTTRGLGYPPESPFRAAPYSGLGRRKTPQIKLFQTNRGCGRTVHLIRTSGIPILLRMRSRIPCKSASFPSIGAMTRSGIPGT